jgi:hydrogenase nickel incorporation protein HypB
MNRIPLEKKVLNENDRIADELRARFREHGILCLNFVSSPGAGKTLLLEKTLESFSRGERVAVLTGDVQTDNDARRLARWGFPVKQITTGGACHLDARMVERALADWRLEELDLLLIENVGNLVCPASYDLGEAEKVVVLSVAEGDDKPLKYPAMFFRAGLLILSKIDLLPYVPFGLATARENARRIHPEIEILELSSTTGAGLGSWQAWLRDRRRAASAELRDAAQAARSQG